MSVQGVHEAQLRRGLGDSSRQGDAAAEDLLHQQRREAGGMHTLKNLHPYPSCSLPGERDLASRRDTSPVLQPRPGRLTHPVHQLGAGEGGQRDGDLHRVLRGRVRPSRRYLVRNWDRPDSRLVCSQRG